MAKKRKKLCIYCQAARAVESDHVPPKAIFPPPRPSTLVTVPACKKCNRGASQDDEYFKLVIPSRHDVGGNKFARRANDSALKGLFRKQSVGFKRKFLKSVDEVEITTPGGLYLGKGMQMRPNYYRIEKVVRRTVRALYYQTHDHCPLPVDCPIWTAADLGFKGVRGEDLEKQKVFFSKLLASDPHIVHPEIFSYWIQDIEGEDFMSVWFLLFYTKIWFVAFTNTPDPPPNG